MSYRGIRRRFIDYFLKHDHFFVPSSSVIPSFNDRSCLFVNAGMFQFKNQFLGLGVNETTPVRVTNSQKCVRISGKHNDIDEVGGDGHHHTFFEMLGNWSFGDYFNEEACHMALDLLVNHYNLPLSKLYFTFHGGGHKVASDLQTRDIWISLGVPTNQIITNNLSDNYHAPAKTDNFWEMGSTGPCGPCTEIFYDVNGVLKEGQKFTMEHIDLLEEIWNIVMIKYNKVSEGTLTPLAKNHIDTGLGFERMVKILEGKESNYDTSLFAPLVEYLEDESQTQVKMRNCTPRQRRAFYLVLDHLRSLTITLTDGASFSAGGRGPPLKQLMKRTMWFSEQVLGIRQIHWARVVDIMSEIYDDIFPEIGQNKEAAVEALTNEYKKTVVGLYQMEKSLLHKIQKGTLTQMDIQFLHESKGMPFQVARDICDANQGC